MTDKLNRLTSTFAKILMALVPILVLKIGCTFMIGEPKLPENYDIL